MAGEWKSLPLSSLLVEGRGISYGVVQPGTHQDGGVPIVRVADIRHGRIAVDQPMRVAPEIEAAYVRTRLRGGELLLTLVGTVGEAAVVPPEMKGWNVARAVAVIPIRVDVGAYWVKLALSAPEAREMIYGRLNTTVQATLNLKDVAQLPIILPDEDERERISNIISTIDAKIELNHRMNGTLEAIARTIFKSWFVDFDPVRAKASGESHESICRRLGLTPGHLALFPDRLVDSELGEIPEAWRVSNLGGEVKTLLGGTPSRDEPSYWGGDIPWINSGKANEFRIIEPSEFITTAGFESSATKLLPERTVVIAITGATLGQVSITEIATCANQSIVGVVGTENLPSEFIYFWVKENINKLIAKQTGGAQQHINKSNVNELPVVCPDRHALNAYMAMASPIFNRIKVASFELNTLSKIRDTLLPKLLSGELRVTVAGAA